MLNQISCHAGLTPYMAESDRELTRKRKEAGLNAEESESTVHATCTLRRGLLSTSCSHAAENFEIKGD